MEEVHFIVTQYRVTLLEGPTISSGTCELLLKVLRALRTASDEEVEELIYDVYVSEAFDHCYVLTKLGFNAERHRIMMLVPTTPREVAVISKYRIVSEEWVTAFGEKSKVMNNYRFMWYGGWCESI